MTPHVFHDPSRRRWRWIRRVAVIATVIALVTIGTFGASILFLRPTLPQVSISATVRNSLHSVIPHLPVRKKSLQRFTYSKTRRQLLAEIAKENSVRRAPVADSVGIVAGFYAPWQQASLRSLQVNASHMTHLFPAWVHIAPDGQSLDFTDWNPTTSPSTPAVLTIAHENGLKILPVVNNAQSGLFDGARMHRILTDEALQTKVLGELKTWLERNDFDGVNFDFENLAPADYDALPDFLDKARSDFEGSNLLITADLEVRPTGLDWKLAAEPCDFVVVMAYDEHASAGAPGPISSIMWFRDAVDRAVASIPRTKLVIGLANYAYDWTDGGDRAIPLSYQAALLTAHDNYQQNAPSEVVDFDPTTLNATFDYTDDSGKSHEVWMLDAVTAANQWLIAKSHHVRGAALWVLGLEDPSVWSFLDRQQLRLPASREALQKISFPYDVDFVGDGEILQVDATPHLGSRAIEQDKQTGLFVDESYESFPTSYVIRRSGYQPKKVALTFDDGPSSPYSSQILDELNSLHVPATFFVIGENAYRYPDLVERMWREGHEIGNHSFTHPNMGEVSEKRQQLELNGTQRALQSIIGRSTLLFRPPYNADAEPTSMEQVMPIVEATKLGYLTVGELIDPEDWDLNAIFPNGTIHHRTAEDLVRDALQQLSMKRGNTILLHDGGGDRSETVRAIPLLVNALRKQGYQFVTVSQLVSSTRDQVMPKTEKAESLLLRDDRMVFEVMNWTEIVLSIVFISAIILGTLRVMYILTLALLARRREKHESFDPSYAPSVSVLIAAFNEEKVIARTIHGVLASDYPNLEIIVVDDGSKDGTSAVVSSEFAGDPRVRLVQQVNGGKASALNRAISNATGEIFVCLDADTIFAKDTISKLVRRFSDASVGAVAGNVKVGNRVNSLTMWQAIEYVTSQNLDRRAHSLLNCVTVVPGAAGAWRREAMVAAGGYLGDTMAEDMDLTWRIRLLGWKVVNESQAVAFTEAPDQLRALFKQRFRWAYGTLQALWKHRRALGRYGWFGRLMLPLLWIFQILFQALSPIVDLQLLWVLVTIGITYVTTGFGVSDWQPLPQEIASLTEIGVMYAFFFAIELVASWVAFAMDREDKKILWWLFWQKFVYRQLMYGVVVKAIFTALRGMRTGWGKLERKGTVTLAVD